MHFKARIAAVLALVCMTCGVAAAGRLEMTGADEGQTGLSVFQKKETIYFWYADEAMSDYFNSAAVAFAKEKNVRVYLLHFPDPIRMPSQKVWHGVKRKKKKPGLCLIFQLIRWMWAEPMTLM